MIDVEGFYEQNGIPKPILSPLNEQQKDGQTTPLTNEELLVMTPAFVHGLDLKTNEWCTVPVTGVTDIVFKPFAFDTLVLPSKEKELAWALADSNKKLSHGNNTDFVREGLRGVTMLLCGPPGVGKTYTARAIAEKAETPLYQLCAGELGTDPKAMDAALEKAMSLCKRWGAQLLLEDEDLFLGLSLGHADRLKTVLGSSKLPSHSIALTLLISSLLIVTRDLKLTPNPRLSPPSPS